MGGTVWIFKGSSSFALACDVTTFHLLHTNFICMDDPLLLFCRSFFPSRGSKVGRPLLSKSD